MQAMQRRVGVTTGVIGNFKGFKMSGLRHVVGEQIQGLRNCEIDDQKAFRRLQVTNIALGNTAGMLTPAVTFAAFAIAELVSHGAEFSVVTAFTSLSLLGILINPVAELVTATRNLASALSCLVVSKSISRSQGGRTTELRPCRPPLRPTVLHAVNLDILRSTFIILVGPIGSGKTTLLRSLLGDKIHRLWRYRSASPQQIAYCDQEQPWIQNISTKQNILGISDYNEKRYRTIFEAWQLNDDLEQLPRGDETLGGSKGVSLSGGQKQRIVSEFQVVTLRSYHC
jgi:ABC-type bacteriocin/lantibiotic exporter with double-glycine peptidase domain